MVGEHIRALKGGRWVHAIDCGDETVLHLVEEATPPRVRRAYRPEFVAGAQAVELVTHRERTYPGKEVVRRAYSRASDPALATMFGDSEAFAEWCKTGRSSGQLNVALEVPGVGPAPAAPPKPAATNPSAKAKRAPKAKAKPAAKPKAKRAAAKPARKVARAKPARKIARARPASRRPKPPKRKTARR
ncbi:MAG TPA: hypothetical protein VF894_12855 [Anaeromyxobacter sp.]